MKRGLWDYFVIGFKLSLIIGLSSLILIIPNYLLQGKIINTFEDVSSISLTGSDALFYILITIVLSITTIILHGYFVNKFKDWIFK